MMKIEREELGGGSYAAWGVSNSVDCRNIQWVFGEDDEFFSGMWDCFVGISGISSLPDDPFRMSSDENQMGLLFVSKSEPLLEMSDCNTIEGFNLPEDPFCMDVRSTLCTFSDDSTDDGGGEPHVAFELVLPYLEMKDVLAVEGVCRSLRDSVRREPFLWRTIDFADIFFKSRVNDDALLKLTRRARGNLHSLNLGGCVGITDYGLMQVLATNPHLTKLRISGCYRLSTAGMLSTLRDLKSSNRLGVKSLITGGALYFTKEQFQELNFLLGADGKPGPRSRKHKRFLYTSRRSELCLEDDRVTDLEICPWCEKPSLVFDCAAETCPLRKDQDPCPKSSCRACIVCIERCHECGGCLNDCERNIFCFAFICVVCYERRSNQLQVFPSSQNNT